MESVSDSLLHELSSNGAVHSATDGANLQLVSKLTGVAGQD